MQKICIILQENVFFLCKNDFFCSKTCIYSRNVVILQRFWNESYR